MDTGKKKRVRKRNPNNPPHTSRRAPLPGYDVAAQVPESTPSSIAIVPPIFSTASGRSSNHSTETRDDVVNLNSPSTSTKDRTTETSQRVCMEQTDFPGFPPIWNEFRKTNQLCDCSIRSSEGEVYHAHRVILASTSPYFRFCFSSPFQEMDGDITVTNLPSSTLSSLLEFCYTGKTHICDENALRLLKIASHFEMNPLVQACIRYFESNLSPDTCLEIFNACRDYYCPKTFKLARGYILFFFKEIVALQDFKELVFMDIKSYLEDDLLNVISEEAVFEALKIWVEYDLEDRLDRVVELLRCVRFGLMSYRYYTANVLHWKLVQENHEAKVALFDATTFWAQMDPRRGLQLDLNNPLLRPRIPAEIIFVIGGWSAGDPAKFLETYDSRADRWFSISGVDVAPRTYHGLVTYNHLVYMIGGFDGKEYFNTVQCFNPITVVWKEKSCMNYPRCYVSCCVLESFIYAIGGFNGRTRMNSVERYNIKRNQWDLVASMNRQRSDCSACSIMGKIYVAGGYNGEDILDSVEIYNPDVEPDGIWTLTHPMTSPRSGVALTAYNEQVYALGGFDGFERLNTVERFDPLKPTGWQEVADMECPRSNFATAVVDNMILVIGGFNGKRTIAHVEGYFSGTNEWYRVAHLNQNRSGLSAVVLRCLPNGRDYSYHALMPKNFSAKHGRRFRQRRNRR